MRLYLRVVIAAVTFSAIGFGQETKDQTYEIRGRVLEFGLSQGLSDVQVQVERYEGEALSSLSPKKLAGTVKTDMSGGFAFRFPEPGSFRVSISREGYATPGGYMDGLSPNAEIRLTREAPVKELEFQLGRPAEISGRIIDQETREPVQGLPVAAMQFGYAVGKVMMMPAGSATTGEDGGFLFRGLTPTRYLVAVGPRMRNEMDLRRQPELKALGIEDRVLAKFTEKDRTLTDLDYDSTYWPGGTGLVDASPVTVASGEKLEIGQMIVRKTPKYRVLLSTAGSECTGVESVEVATRSDVDWQSMFTSMVGRIPCGSSALLRGFTPGTYDLEIVGSGKAGATAAQSFRVNHGDTTITVPLRRGVDLEGKLLLADGAAKVDSKGIMLHLQPVSYGGIRHAMVRIDANGKFKFENVGVREFRLRVVGVPETHYVKDVQYNGVAAPGRLFAVNAGAIDQSLALVLDDKPGVVTGSVTDGLKAAARAHVVAIPWPAPAGIQMFDSQLRATCDERGQFTISGMPPGDYRFLAVAPELQRSLSKPGVLERMLGNAAPVSVGKGQLRSVSLKLEKP